ncbi:Nucleotidylyl transferase [Corynespora cassiicola Philippines]|uniref:arginine--tRNA ligase n=1 Tax=Corynespora cassiicola Philippines TaxID=1448308 RepID=A0A2T2NJR2_CORCC|nr:Nucleotidylyl transferase [Corynespora cassiicola Philippines]
MSTATVAEIEKAIASLNLTVPAPHYEPANIQAKPLDLFRSYLAGILQELVGCEPALAYSSIQWPNNIWNGDLAVILPRLSPDADASELAANLMRQFPREHPLFPLPFLEGVHFRIFFNCGALGQILIPYIIDQKEKYGSDLSLGKVDPVSADSASKKLVVELSSPNITSEFQGKHLRSTILGAFISKLHEDMGWEVARINYLGDWGKPIALLKVGWERFGSEEAYQADPVGHLLDIFQQINDLFLPEQAESKRLRDEATKNGQDAAEAQLEIESKGIFAERNAACSKLEDGDEETVAFWKKVRDANIENYTEFYSRLGITFDEYSGESQVSPETMAEIEQMLKDKGISEESGGAWIVHMQKLGAKTGTAIIRDRSGSSTYLLRDLAAVIERSRKYQFDKMIYVVANDNNAHFSQFFKIIKALDMDGLAAKLQHVRLSEVSKMAEKLGKGYKPQAILDKCEESMLESLKSDESKAEPFGDPEAAAKSMGISALLVQEFSTRSTTNHSFDVGAMTSFKTGSGPELQYWYAKLCSKLNGVTGLPDLSADDYESLATDEHADLLRTLIQYPEITHATYDSLEPTAIVNFLTNIVGQLKEIFEGGGGSEDGDEGAEPAAGPEEDSVIPARQALYEATRIVLENGMKLLGFSPVRAEPVRADTPVAE